MAGSRVNTPIAPLNQCDSCGYQGPSGVLEGVPGGPNQKGSNQITQ